MRKIDSVIIIDSNTIDNFINNQLLKHYGVTNIFVFNRYYEAIRFLRKTNSKFQFVIVGDNPGFSCEFEVIIKLRELKQYKRHTKIILLSSSLNPSDKEMAKMNSVLFIEKPLNINALINNL